MYRPSLPLTMAGANAALAAGLGEIAAGSTVFDLADATATDSAAVAILLAWQRAARARGAALEFRNLPAGLGSLAALYGVDELLGLNNHDAQLRHRA